jgi:aryl-alcohol dehydrogenase-like predicted oxidoreductase
VRHIGLSEVGAETVRRAAAVAPICDLQIEYSLLSRGIEDAILPVCRELGIGITAYGVLSRGLIGGSGTVEGARAASPRFQGANREHNEALVARLAELAAAKGASIAQLAIAWVAAQVDRDRVSLSPAELARIEELVPRGAAQGERYPSRHMADLDSER